MAVSYTHLDVYKRQIRVFDEVLKPLGKRPKGVRIDSGDIAYLSKKVRAMLDQAGYPDCGICASNSLDEYIVRDLLVQGAQIDSFGIGENLITSKSSPVFGGVYKLEMCIRDRGEESRQEAQLAGQHQHPPALLPAQIGPPRGGQWFTGPVHCRSAPSRSN